MTNLATIDLWLDEGNVTHVVDDEGRLLLLHNGQTLRLDQDETDYYFEKSVKKYRLVVEDGDFN